MMMAGFFLLLAALALLIRGLVMFIPLSKAKERLKPARRFILAGFLATLAGSTMMEAAQRPALSPNEIAKAKVDANLLAEALSEKMGPCDRYEKFMQDPTKYDDAVEAYNEAHSAKERCRTSSHDVNDQKIPDDVNDIFHDLVSDVKKDCSDAYYGREIMYFSLANALNSNGEVSKISEFQNEVRSSDIKIGNCRTELGHLRGG